MRSLIKLFILIILFAMGSQTGFSQTNPRETDEFKRQMMIYAQAKNYSDIGVAKNAVYNMLAMDPSAVTLLDTLMIMYYEYNQYAPSLLVSLDVLKINPENLVALEINAVCYENLQLYDKALASYEKLYLKNNNLNTMYKVAFLQFNLKRYAESKISADIIYKNPESDSLNIVFNPTRNTEEQVTMKSAILNLKGLIAKEEGKKEEARKFFTDALAESKPFTFAAQNLASLDQ